MNPDPTPKLPPVLQGFSAPPFDGVTRDKGDRFAWWSWNPTYPYWSKSCHQGVTIEEAIEAIKAPSAIKLRHYHNKLIEERDGALIEVLDIPHGTPLETIALANGIGTDKHIPGKWQWMADWCKKKGISPFVSTNWINAEEEWELANGIVVEEEICGTCDGRGCPVCGPEIEPTTEDGREQFGLPPLDPLPSAPVIQPTSDPCESEAKPEAEGATPITDSESFTMKRVPVRVGLNGVAFTEAEVTPSWVSRKLETELAAANSEKATLTEHLKLTREDLKEAQDHFHEFKMDAELSISQANAAVGRLTEGLRRVLRYAERNTCLHEETHRAGAIWEVCDSCGKKWADDEGGKPENAHEWPDDITFAQDVLLSTPPAPDGWMEIESAPLNQAVNVFIPDSEHYGDGIYRAIHVNMGSGKRWTTTGLSCGRDCGERQPTHWMPLPKPPTGNGGAL